MTGGCEVRALEAKNQSLTPVLALEMGALSAQTAPSMDKAPKKARVVRVSKGPNEPPKPCKPRGPRKAKDGFGELERVKSPQGKRVPKVRAARPLRQGRGRGKGKQPLNDLTVHEGVLPVFQRPTIELNEVFPAKTRCKTAPGKHIVAEERHRIFPDGQQTSNKEQQIHGDDHRIQGGTNNIDDKEEVWTQTKMVELMREICATVQADMGGPESGIEIFSEPPPNWPTSPDVAEEAPEDITEEWEEDNTSILMF
jgi:hypothetical protein